jgi:ABC-type dipeptide/oligopeptide/nickel transport system permease component
MLTFIVRRSLLVIPILLVVLTIVFIMARVLPGDPALALLGDYASESTLNALRERMGINRPITVQYVDFLGGLLHGDLGRSMITGMPISTSVVRALPYTLELTFAGIFIGLIVGIPLGIVGSVKRNTTVDYLGRLFSLVGQSFPSFYLALLMMWIFAVKWPLFPSIGGGHSTNIMDVMYHLCLPALTMGLVMTAYISRVCRSVMLNTLTEDYIRTAHSKGLSERRVLYKHALRNAMIPLISVVGVYSIVLIGGSIMVEIIFARPGLGKMMIGAMLQRDYITLQSVMVIYSVFVVFINLFVDLTYGFIDPRIRYA